MATVYEYAGNMHIHTVYSDGEGTHHEIANAAIRAGLDFIITTDHDVWVDGVQGIYSENDGKRVLLLTGEEIHDMNRIPTANHLLVYGVEEELTPYAGDLQRVIDRVNEKKGLCFLAHPNEVASPAFHEAAIEWKDRDVEGYHGLEIWNYMSEFKAHLTDKKTGLQAALNPGKFISGPFPETLALWDQLLLEGKRVFIIGNADAHATVYELGPIKREVFPYEHLFNCVNTHIISKHAFTGDLSHDSKLIYHALRYGQSFVGYDLPASTRGFRFSAQGHHSEAMMGERIRLGHGVTLQIVSPRIADIRLFKDGQLIHQETDGTHSIFIATKPGIYRVEVHLDFNGKRRGWIFSNPIFVTN